MAGFYPESWLRELTEKNDIVDVISSYVDLKLKGGRYWGCCPFHQEKTASFNVDGTKQFFYCFGCGQGGNVIHFIMKHEHLRFPEAVEFLAARAHMEVPTGGDSKVEKERQEQKKRHYAIYKEAGRFYCHQLLQDQGEAMVYVKKRGITLDVIKKFGIGYAPKGGHAMKDHLLRLGFTEQELVGHGLVHKSKKLDMFFHRIMFPIMDIYGNCIAFGGRVLDDSLPKYVNSQDSPFYNKRRHLYGLNVARTQRSLARLILVEGYMDVVTVSSFGVPGAVASLGTSLTIEQARLMKRFCDTVLIAYDGDEAGQNAAVRACGILSEAGLGGRVVCFPKGEDPDEYLKTHGADAFDVLLGKAVMPYQFQLTLLAAKANLKDEMQRRTFALQALKVCAGLTNQLDQEDMLKEIQVRTGYSLDVLKKQRRDLRRDVLQRTDVRQAAAEKPAREAALSAERMVLKLGLNGYDRLILDKLSQEDFFDTYHQVVFTRLGEIDEGALLAEAQDEETAKKAAEILSALDEKTDQEQAAKDCIAILQKRRLKAEIDEKKEQLRAPGILEQEKKRLLSEISSLQIKWNEL